MNNKDIQEVLYTVDSKIVTYRIGENYVPTCQTNHLAKCIWRLERFIVKHNYVFTDETPSGPCYIGRFVPIFQLKLNRHLVNCHGIYTSDLHDWIQIDLIELLQFRIRFDDFLKREARRYDDEEEVQI